MDLRRTYLLDKEFQLKFVGFLLTLCGVVFLNFAVMIYFFFKKTDELAMTLHLYNAPHYAYFISHQKSFFIIESTVFLIGSMLIISFIGIRLSHRMAGMMWKVSRHLKNMIKGDYSKMLYLRKKDYFKWLADDLNVIQGRLKESNKK